MEGEKAALLKRTEFNKGDSVSPSATVGGAGEITVEERVVKCCCFESTKLGKVPIVRTVFRKQEEVSAQDTTISYLLHCK